MTRRVVVIGGLGFFGAALVERLRALGVTPALAGRRGDVDVRLDAEDPASLRAALRAGDVVVDAAGPFQARTTAVVEAATEVGFDAIDLADSAAHVLRVQALEARVAASGVRVLTACSSLSAVSAALVRRSGVAEPVRVTALLAPATRDTARPATARALLLGVGAPALVLRGGALVERRAWSEARDADLPPPIGRVRARLLESADAVTLPRAWPSLATVEFFAAARVPGLDLLLAGASRWRPLRAALRGGVRAFLPLARLLGSRAGAFGVEVEDRDGRVRRLALAAPRHSHVVSVAPAAVAAAAIAAGRYEPTGLVRADRLVDPDELLAHLAGVGVTLHES